MYFRFIIACVCWFILFSILYCIIPVFTWLFFDTFTEVSQHPAYCFIGCIGAGFAAAMIMEMTFDKKFYIKR